MSGWNEDSFLEETMPLLQQKLRPGWCPDAETVCAVAAGDASDALRLAIAAHTVQCQACANLHERLRRFAQADSPFPLQEPDWSETEKRLARWLASFLDEEANIHRVGHRVSESGIRLVWHRLKKPLGAVQIRWLLAPAATLALVICSFLAGRVSVRLGPQIVTEALPTKLAIEDATAPQTVKQGVQTASLPHPAAEQSKGVASGGDRIAGSGVRPIPSHQQQTAVTTPPGSTGLDAPQPAGASTPLSTISPVAQNDRAIQEAERASGPATSALPQRPTDRGAVQAPAALGIKPVLASRSGGATVHSARTEQPSAIPAPAEIRLDAGTRVWISLKSVRERADGVSDFSGVVLLPVVQSGAVLLERNTEISGVVGVQQGKTAVQIMELVSNGARYRLKGTGESANTRPEMGTAVKFDSGKVLETWIVSASIFGKLPKEVGAPGK